VSSIVRASAILAAIVTLLAQPPQPPTFRSGADLVQIDVSVLDSDRVPVRGLTAGDFVVREEGKPRPVVAVSEVVLPALAREAGDGTLRSSWTAEIPPDIGTNQQDEARLFVIVLDDALVPHDPRIAESAKEVGRAVVGRLTALDRAAVVFTSNATSAQGFTSDRQRLLAAIDSFTPRGKRRYAGDWMTLADTNGEASSAKTLSNVADHLVNLPGPRKTVFYVSPGIPVDLKRLAPGTQEGQVMDEIHRVFAKALRANVTIHAIDPGGLYGFASTMVDAGARSASETSVATHLESMRQNVLGAISATTGGRLVVRTDGFDSGVENIFRESRSYYLVGFQPGSARQDGKYRRIDVRVSRPGVAVLARGGYFATALGTPGKPAVTGLEAAVNGFAAHPGVPLQLSAAVFAKPNRRTASVAVVLGVRHSTASGILGAEKALMLLRAFAQDGREVASQRVSADIVLRRGSLPTVYYELLAQLDLPPGRYQLRIAAELGRQRLTGSVFHEVTVPDFAGAQLSLSDVVLSTAPELHSAPRGALSTLLPVVPTSNREFPRSIRLSAFGRVYQGDGETPSAASLTATVVDSRGTEVAKFDHSLGPEQFKSGGAEYGLDIPVSKLPPGQYLLTVRATAGAAADTRHVRFRID
jgi:VWFA-related protein